MTHKELQKLEERNALMPLLKELQIQSVTYSEEPDARIFYDKKNIGIEIVGYHRSEANMKASSALDKSLKKYEDIINERGEMGKQITVMMDDDQTAYYKKSNENQLFREIENSINAIDEYRQYVLFADADPILPPNEKCVVARGGIAFCQQVSIEQLHEIVEKKELRLKQYKILPQNKTLDEYWLVIYVNQHEYDYFQRQETAKIETEYSRVYLTHSSDGVLLLK